MGVKGFQNYTNSAGLERKQWWLDQEGGGFGKMDVSIERINRYSTWCWTGIIAGFIIWRICKKLGRDKEAWANKTLWLVFWCQMFFECITWQNWVRWWLGFGAFAESRVRGSTMAAWASVEKQRFSVLESEIDKNSEGQEREGGPEKIFEKIIAKYFPNMRKETFTQIQEVQHLYKINQEGTY